MTSSDWVWDDDEETKENKEYLAGFALPPPAIDDQTPPPPPPAIDDQTPPPPPPAIDHETPPRPPPLFSSVESALIGMGLGVAIGMGLGVAIGMGAMVILLKW